MSKKGKKLIIILILVELIIITVRALEPFVMANYDISGTILNLTFGLLAVLASIVFPVILITQFKHNDILKYMGVLIITSIGFFFIVSFTSDNYLSISAFIFSIIYTLAFLALLIYSAIRNGFKLIEWLLLIRVISLILGNQLISVLIIRLLDDFPIRYIVLSIGIKGFVFHYLIFILSLIVIEKECKKIERSVGLI